MEEREQDKRCWKCRNLCEDYPSCDLTGENVILDMSVKETLECDSFEEIESGERLE